MQQTSCGKPKYEDANKKFFANLLSFISFSFTILLFFSLGFARLSGISLHDCAKEHIINAVQTPDPNVQVANANLAGEKNQDNVKSEKSEVSQILEATVIQAPDDIVLTVDTASNDIFQIEDLTVVQVDNLILDNEVIETIPIEDLQTQEQEGRFFKPHLR